MESTFFFSYTRNPKFFFWWNKRKHFFLTAVEFKPFTFPFPGLFPETWHESESVVKTKTAEKFTVYWNSVYWNSTCMGRKIRLWIALNAKVKEMRVENFRLYFWFTKLNRGTSNSVSSNFLCLGVHLLCPSSCHWGTFLWLPRLRS